MSNLLWPDEVGGTKGQRYRPNPQPKIPKTGWKMRHEFPDLSGAHAISFDVETKDTDIADHGPGWGRGVGHIVGVALATDDGFKNYYPIRHEGFENFDPHQVLDYCREQLGRSNQAKVGHNTLYDLGWLEHEGVKIKGDVHDCWTAEKLLDHSATASLEEVGQRYLGGGKESTALYDWAWQAWGHGRAKSHKALRQNAMSNIYRCPPEIVGFYGESDVTLPLLIGPLQFAKLHEAGLWDVYRLECDLQPLLVQMRLAGVSVDLDAAERAYQQIELNATMLQKQIDHIAGRPVSTASPTDMEKLFAKMKIPFDRTKNGKMSLTGEYLQSVEHPVGKLVVDLEELKRYNSTFIKNAILDSNVNGKVHGEFNPLRAVTGRMSASNPNLQQVPSKNELAKVVRAIFIPDKGHDHWRKYDYSSIESRILAHDAVGAGSKALRLEYKNNPKTDYHKFTQEMVKSVVGIWLERKEIKTINFGIIYGMMIKALGRKLGISHNEAENLFDTYHEGLPYVRNTMDHFAKYADDNGEIRTILGRRSLFNKWEPKYSPKGTRLPPLDLERAVQSYGPNIKRAYLHKALNYRIQGTAADLMKTAMVKCWKDGIFDVTGVPRLVVHDEIDLSVRPDWNEEAFAEMQNVMETCIAFKVPIRVEGEWGPNWSQLYPI